VLAGLDGLDAMPAQAGRAAPDQHVAVFEQDALRLVAPRQAAEQEAGGQAEGEGNDGQVQVGLILVLVQGHLRAGSIAVDQAGVGSKAGKPGLPSGIHGGLPPAGRHRRPGASIQGVGRAVAVALSVRHPAQGATVAHGDRHGESPRGLHVAQGGLGQKGGEFRQQDRGFGLEAMAPQHGAGRQFEALDRVCEVGEKIKAHAQVRHSGP